MIWILSDFSHFLCNFFVFVLIFTLFASLWGREGEGVWPIRYLLWSETITEECQRSSLCRPRGEADSSSSLSFSLSWISFLQCNDLVWFDLVWFGLVWFGLVWSSPVRPSSALHGKHSRDENECGARWGVLHNQTTFPPPSLITIYEAPCPSTKVKHPWHKSKAPLTQK